MGGGRGGKGGGKTMGGQIGGGEGIQRRAEQTNGGGPKVGSSDGKLQDYLSHSGGQKPKIYGQRGRSPSESRKRSGGKGEDNVVHGQMGYLEWCGILRGNEIQVGHMPANTKRYKRHMNETGFVSRSLRITMRNHNGEER